MLNKATGATAIGCIDTNNVLSSISLSGSNKTATYTASETCWCVAELQSASTSATTIKINGVVVGMAQDTYGGNGVGSSVCIPVIKDQVLSFATSSHSNSRLLATIYGTTR